MVGKTNILEEQHKQTPHVHIRNELDSTLVKLKLHIYLLQICNVNKRENGIKMYLQRYYTPLVIKQMYRNGGSCWQCGVKNAGFAHTVYGGIVEQSKIFG